MSSSDTPRTNAQKRGDFVHINFARELERENAALRNEIARLNGQTIWMCACGGTDCAGRKTNAALRKGITLAVKWAELGLVDYLPEYARKGFLNDWKKLEQLLTEEEEQ